LFAIGYFWLIYYAPAVGGIKRSLDPSVCLSDGAAALGTLAACSLATAGHQRCADFGRRSAANRTAIGGGGIPSHCRRGDNLSNYIKTFSVSLFCARSPAAPGGNCLLSPVSNATAREPPCGTSPRRLASAAVVGRRDQRPRSSISGRDLCVARLGVFTDTRHQRAMNERPT